MPHLGFYNGLMEKQIVIKGTNNLFRLVKSLSKREKRIIIGYFGGLSGKKDRLYLRLFHVLDAMPADQYDEKTVETACGVGVRKLTTTKYYLQQAVLNVLRNGYAPDGRETKLWNILLDVEILMAKDLSDMAWKRLIAAEKLCAKHPHPYFSVRIERLRAELDTSRFRSAKARLNEIEDFSTRVSKSAVRFGNLEYCRQLLQQCNHELGQGQMPSTDLLERGLRTVDAQDDPSLRPYARVYGVMCAMAAGSDEQKLVGFIEGLRTFEVDVFSQSDGKNLSETIYWLGSRFIQTGNIKALKTLLVIAASWSDNDPKNPDLQLLHHGLSLRFGLSIGRSSVELEADARELEKPLSSPKGTRIVQSRLKIEGEYWLAAYELRERSYNRAYGRLASLFSVPLNHLYSEEFQVAARLLFLICLFEKGSFHELGSRNRELALFIQRCKGLHTYELNFINNMRRVRVFESLNAEARFYLDVLERVERINCENGYLRIGNTVLTTFWIRLRLPN